MKVIQEEAEFKPVIIKLESQFEVDIMSDLMAWCYNSLAYSNSNDAEIRKFMSEISGSLAKISSYAHDFVLLDGELSSGKLKFK